MSYFKLSTVAVVASLMLGCVEDGSDGLNSLVNQSQLEIGNEFCRNGGLQVDSGVDMDANGILDSGEIESTEYLCNEPITQLKANDILESTANPWFVESEWEVEQAQQDIASIVKAKGRAKNIILFVGDGMGISTLTAARILDGQNKGLPGEENRLSFEEMPFAGLAKTYNVDAQTPDSAGTMTAMISGVKTDVGVIGVAEGVVRGDCKSVSGNELVSGLELAEIAGKSTGIISTARITHATPAATYAKSADRNWEDNSDMPASAIEEGCEDIASQLINFETNLEARFTGLNIDGIEVVMGGGRRHFLPKDPEFNSPDAVSSVEGDRTDNRNLIEEWQSLYPQGHYVYDQAGFNALDSESTEHLFALFNESHMQYEADRENDIAGEPSLTEMTSKGIDILDNNKNGFFLVVEAGRIDHGHHAGNAYNALNDTIELSEAVKVAMEKTNPEETLIIVTADHSHVMTIAGYPKRGNPILGKVVSVGETEAALAADELPYTTLGYTNGRGFKDLGVETDADAGYDYDAVTGRVDLTLIDTLQPGFHQESLVPLSSETHAGEDVAVYAQGPGAHLVNGTNEQHLIFHIMDFAGNLVNKAETAVN
ncbi:alkaline phosphatase [Aliikangiella sp. G2MR2-5]|uniref:alkaline phosphatase n=1 Tax=Aliikangiella sp. G2MR2-5 TaxID=2788943 RepID=UPI0018ABEA19|nr:alkaline phosphatase [Aliikangiella sp. G2MR2-5]